MVYLRRSLSFIAQGVAPLGKACNLGGGRGRSGNVCLCFPEICPVRAYASTFAAPLSDQSAFKVHKVLRLPRKLRFKVHFTNTAPTTKSALQGAQSTLAAQPARQDSHGAVLPWRPAARALPKTTSRRQNAALARDVLRFLTRTTCRLKSRFTAPATKSESAQDHRRVQSILCLPRNMRIDVQPLRSHEKSTVRTPSVTTLFGEATGGKT